MNVPVTSISCIYLKHSCFFPGNWIQVTHPKIIMSGLLISLKVKVNQQQSPLTLSM